MTPMVTRQVDGIMIVDIPSAFMSMGRSSDNRQKLHEIVMELLANGHKKIVFNLSQAQCMGHCALGELCRSFKMIRESRGQLKLCSLQPGVRAAFEYVRLLKVFDVHEDEAGAIRSFDAA